MNEDYIRQRITDLRIKKGISERKMSLDLGHSSSYIRSISSGRALPSMAEFLYICEYFDISPMEFFIEQDLNQSQKEIIQAVLKLPEEDLTYLIELIKRFK